MCPAIFKIEIQYLCSKNTVSVPFSSKIWFDNLENRHAREETHEGRDLQWIGVYVNGKYGYVRGEKPVYPNWLNLFHPARKDKGTCGGVLGIDFARWWTFTAYRFDLPLFSSSKGDCSP